MPIRPVYILLCVLGLLSACVSRPAVEPMHAQGNSTAAGRTTPIPDRPIHLAGNCAQTEEDGFREQAVLDVRDNTVHKLSWKIWVGKRGTCQFEGTDFVQVQKRPSVEMRAKDGSSCKLLIWQTPQRVTLAHAGCEARCTAGIYDDAWPVMFHPNNGSCARLG
jgi:hypothetical protein